MPQRNKKQLPLKVIHEKSDKRKALAKEYVQNYLMPTLHEGLTRLKTEEPEDKLRFLVKTFLIL